MTSTRQIHSNSQCTIHILHIVSGDLWAGAEVMLYTLLKTLYKEPNTRVSAVILNPGMLEQKLRNFGISVHVLDESNLNSFQILYRLNKIIDDLKPDVIHTHRNKENILGSIAAWYNHRTPSLQTLHGAPEHPPSLHQLPKRLILFIDWLLGRFYQRYIIAVSSDLAKKLERDFPKTKIKVIENGADIESLTKCNTPATSKKTNKSQYRIGIAGRLTQVKRVDLFIECALYLKQHDPDLPVDFYIYGDGPLRHTLQAHVHSQQAEDYIHFEGHHENIASQLQKLDALLMTSDHEGMPMVLLEAMCLQIPIIAHAIGGIPQLLDEGTCGVLINEHTPEAFAKAVIKLINEPERYRQLASMAFERVKEFYSAERTAAAYLNVYKQIASHQ